MSWLSVKHENLHLLIGAWLVIDALISVIYSTDLIWQFQVGRVVRLAIGILIVFKQLPLTYTSWIGLYLASEAIGSTVISPDDAPLWQAGRIGRVLIGAWMYQDGQKHHSHSKK